MNNRTYTPNHRARAIRDAIFLLAVAIALGIGMALVSPASGAELRQVGAGSIAGTVTVTGQSAAGLTVELRQRANSGEETVLGTATTDDTGSYSFPNQPSAPNDAFYYIRLGSGKGTLATWYTFPIIYVQGNAFTVPSVDLSDVELVDPGQGATVSLPSTLTWKARRSGETYRIFVYASGKTDKVALDSGSLGTNTQFTIAEGALPDGAYEAVVQVRDAVVGYGQSQSRFRFTIGKTAVESSQGTVPGVEPVAPGGQPENPPATSPPQEPAPTSAPQAEPQPDIDLHLSGDKTAVGQGENIIFTIEVSNNGDAPAAGVVVTDKLPAGVTVDPAGAKSSAGSVKVEGDTVKADVGNLAPNEKVRVEIPVSVGSSAGSNISNQASALYNGASNPVQSNAYIAQVSALASGPAESQPQSQPQQPPASQPQQPPASQPSGPASNPPAAPPADNSKAPASNPPASQPQQPPASQPQKPVVAPQQKPATAPATKQPAAPIPQTGGAFPVVFALLLVLFTLLARYLRGRTHRRV
ncbi:MAG TPA: hypothetical protein VGE45_19075 [Chloroflexia bacterium]|jgi:uncharacterized repeat protein (TIGR01451 family)